MGDTLVTVAAMLVMGVVFVNGWTDAPNAIATCVTTRAMSWRAAFGMAAGMNLLGTVTTSLLIPQVAVTVYRSVGFDTVAKARTALCAALLAVVVWAVAAWWCGIPTSESHALLAGLSGAAWAVGGTVRFAEWGRVLCGLFVFTPLAAAGAFCLARWVFHLCRGCDRTAAHRRFRRAQCAAGAATAFMHGAQDGQKFQGVFLLALIGGQESGTSVFSPPLWLAAAVALVMAVGTAAGGRRIIQTVGQEMVVLTPPAGVAAEAATAGCLLLCSLLGVPVSTTNIKTAAMMGAGAARRLSAVNWGVVRELVLAWAFTFPACGILGFFTAQLFLLVF